MWIVYFHEDSWECGFEVPTEKEAVEYCEENEGYRYIYVGQEVSKMTVEYRDELGVVTEEVDDYGISFLEGKAYFNDKVIDMSSLVSIKEE